MRHTSSNRVVHRLIKTRLEQNNTYKVKKKKKNTNKIMKKSATHVVSRPPEVTQCDVCLRALRRPKTTTYLYIIIISGKL